MTIPLGKIDIIAVSWDMWDLKISVAEAQQHKLCHDPTLPFPIEKHAHLYTESAVVINESPASAYPLPMALR
jgi:hypothetical protein